MEHETAARAQPPKGTANADTQVPFCRGTRVGAPSSGAAAPSRGVAGCRGLSSGSVEPGRDQTHALCPGQGEPWQGFPQ